MKFALTISLCAALTTLTWAAEPYPPAGFQRGGTAWCAQGHFLQVIYEKSPGDPAGQCQLWLEPSNSESKPQHLLSYAKSVSSYVDDSGNHLAILHHATDIDELLYVFFRDAKGTFQRAPSELRAAALQEFCRQTRINLTRADFDLFECIPDQWSEGGLLKAHIQGDSAGADKRFLLNPWYFIYDVEHQKFVPQNFPKNKDAFVRDPH